MEQFGTIYCIKSLLCDKMYIGQTIRKVEYRIKEHFNLEKLEKETRKKSVKLFNAMKKYGKENFIWGIVDVCYDNQEKLNEMENYYINKYDTIENGYNLREGGANGSLNEETKTKISLAIKGRKATEEEKVHKSVATKKMWEEMPEDVRNKRISKLNETRKLIKNRSKSLETIEKIRTSNTGLKRNDEALKNIRLGIKNRKKWEMSKEEKLKRAERFRKLNVKTYRIELFSGEILIIENLKEYATKNNIIYNSIKNCAKQKFSSPKYNIKSITKVENNE